jgi:peptide deformylase
MPSSHRFLGITTSLLLAGCVAAAPQNATPSPRETSMPYSHILQAGAAILRSRAEDVEVWRIRSPEFQQLVRTMIETMRAAPGVGLAAPQIGVPWRVFVLEDRDELIARSTPTERTERERRPFPVRVFVNPFVQPIGDERATFFEGCLSIAGFAGLVERALEVEVTGLDERGEPQQWRVRGWPARILQHEHDHLEGALYVDRMHPRSFTTQEHLKSRFGGRPIAEIRKELGH